MKNLFSVNCSHAAVLFAAFAIVASAPAHANGPNLVTNPGFETGDFTGYTVAGVDTGANGVDNDPFDVHSGTYGAYLGSDGGDGTLTQTIATQAGQAYDISFYMRSDGSLYNDFSATFDGSTIFSAVNIPDNKGFEQITGTEVASGTATPLVFTARNDNGFFGLDDISVTAADVTTPEPSSVASLGMAGMGLVGLALFAKKKKQTVA